jgi:hypothetical protein
MLNIIRRWYKEIIRRKWLVGSLSGADVFNIVSKISNIDLSVFSCEAGTF